MTSSSNGMLLALKKRSLKTYRDTEAVLELQVVQLGAQYAPPGTLVSLEQTRQRIAELEEEIAKLGAAGEEADNPGPENGGRISYTDALLDVRVGQAHQAAGLRRVDEKLDAVLTSVNHNTRRLDRIEGHLSGLGKMARFNGDAG